MAGTHGPTRDARRVLQALNFFMADMQAGIGPFLGVFLLAHGWRNGLIGTVMTVGGDSRRADHDAGRSSGRRVPPHALATRGALAVGSVAIWLRCAPALWLAQQAGRHSMAASAPLAR